MGRRRRRKRGSPGSLESDMDGLHTRVGQQDTQVLYSDTQWDRCEYINEDMDVDKSDDLHDASGKTWGCS